MAISSAGIGSGLDVAKIVEQMVAAEKTPLKKLEVRAEGIKTQISTYGEIKSLTSKLGDIVSKLTRDSAWSTVNISASNSTISGTMTGIASPGTYSINVKQLAQAQTSVLGGGATAVALGKDEAMGSAGKLKLTIGTTSKEIEVSSGDTLSKIAAKLNEAGLGVQASVVTDVDGKERLMLRSQKTGSEGAFTLEIDAGQTGTALQAKLGVAQAQAAQNAQIDLNGVAVESSSNTFANTLPGMSFTVSEKTTTPATLTAKLDTETMKKNIQEFVDAYNALNDLLGKSTKAVRTEDGKVDEAAQDSGDGVLQGDSGTVSLQNTLRMLTMGGSGTSGAFKHLSDIGIQMLEGGKLSVDETKLTKGLASVDDLKGLFAHKADSLGQNGGVAVNFKSFTDKLLAYEGTLNNKSDALKKTLKNNSDQQTKVNERATALEERLYKQYSALDVKMSSLNALNSYVSQMVTTWNKSSS
ncbi:flagellar filament capping protein FliD [Comamonas aquatica]|uniref:flagellar filament capping protein FliD n=1 Tax=Comamonas aquatica TaxID=225991 RepID=UPI003CFC3996